MDLTHLLRSCPLFSDLDERDLDALRQITVCCEYRKGQFVFTEGSPSRGVHVVVAGTVKIFLTGQLDAGGGSSFVNPSAVPANLQFSSSYAGKDGVKLSGGSSAYLSVYAPRTSVELTGGAPVFGALLGKTLVISGGAAVHYDVQMVTVWAPYFTP